MEFDEVCAGRPELNVLLAPDIAKYLEPKEIADERFGGCDRLSEWRLLKALVLDSVSSLITRRVCNLGPTTGGGSAFKSQQPAQISQRVTARDGIQTSCLDATWSPSLDAGQNVVGVCFDGNLKLHLISPGRKIASESSAALSSL